MFSATSVLEFSLIVLCSNLEFNTPTNTTSWTMSFCDLTINKSHFVFELILGYDYGFKLPRFVTLLIKNIAFDEDFALTM